MEVVQTYLLRALASIKENNKAIWKPICNLSLFGMD